MLHLVLALVLSLGYHRTEQNAIATFSETKDGVLVILSPRYIGAVGSLGFSTCHLRDTDCSIEIAPTLRVPVPDGLK